MGVRDYVGKNRFPGVLLGLSGGVDSALTLAVAVEFGPPSGTVSEVDLEGEKLELGINKKS